MNWNRKWNVPGLVVVLMLLGIWLRFFRLGQALLWIDEITITWFAALPRTVGQIFSEIYAADMQGFTGQHMPIQYALLNIFYWLYDAFGVEHVSEWLTRFPYALTGILSLPLVYLFAKRYYRSSKTGLWALLLFAVSFFHVSRSRDATGYAPLILFILLNSYGLVGLLLPDAQMKRRKTIGFFLAFVVGTVGAFLTQLTSWLYLAPEGAVLFGCVVWMLFKDYRNGVRPGDSLKRHAVPVALVFILVITALCFSRFPLAVTKGHGIGEDTRETLGFAHMVYQIANYTWGRGGGRLVGALLVMLSALIVGWRKCRSKLLLNIFLFASPGILIAIVTYKGFHPRYLSVSFPAYIAFLALGLTGAQEAFARFVKVRQGEAIFAIGAVALLAVWLSGPYQALFQIHSKVFPIHEVWQMVEEVGEEDAPYIWQNGFQARQLGQEYEIPGHACILGLYPNGTGEPRQQFEWWNQCLQRIAMAVPTAVMICDENDPFFFDPIYQWPKKYYKNKKDVDNKPWLKSLNEWGFEHHGFDPDHYKYAVYYNTTDDLAEQCRSNQSQMVWPVGKGWRFQRIQK